VLDADAAGTMTPKKHKWQSRFLSRPAICHLLIGAATIRPATIRGDNDGGGLMKLVALSTDERAGAHRGAMAKQSAPSRRFSPALRMSLRSFLPGSSLFSRGPLNVLQAMPRRHRSIC
jgi:hypothetical protein